MHISLTILCILITAADTPNGNCDLGDLQLTSRTDNSSELSSEGRLEVCVNNAWGTICDTAFSSQDAQVACAQLGYDEQGECLCLLLCILYV